MTNTDLSLEEMTVQDMTEVVEVIRHCYDGADDMNNLLDNYNFKEDLKMPGCRWWYKIIHRDICIGAINLAYTGMASMAIRNIAYVEPDNNIYIFELLKQKHPEVLCWLVFDAGDEVNEYSFPDIKMKKTQFREDNGFQFLTNANRRSQYISYETVRSDL